MRTVKEIKTQIKETRKEMKAMGIKRTSCFNGGIDMLTYTWNAQMFRLETELRNAVKREAIEEAKEYTEKWGTETVVL